MAKRVVVSSLLGEEIRETGESSGAASVLDKLNHPKQVTKKREKKTEAVSLEERITYITSEVLRILGRYRENTVVIRTREQLHSYIDAAIAAGIIAVDTETNNSLDPLTCQLMGPCIYTRG